MEPRTSIEPRCDAALRSTEVVNDERERACDVCGSTNRLRLCACLLVLYCSKQCQEGAWRRHKSACKAARRAAKLGAAVPPASAVRDLRPGDQPLPRSAALATAPPLETFPPGASTRAENIGHATLHRRPGTSALVSKVTGAEGVEAAEVAVDIEAVVAALRREAGSASGVQREATVLCNLTGTTACAEISTRAGNAGAVEALMAALHEHATSQDVQYVLFATLGHMCFRNEANQSRAASAGAIEAFVKAMRRLAGGNFSLQERACVALRSVTTCHAGSVYRAVKAGAFEAAVAAMRGHPKISAVQKEACGILGNLVSMASTAADNNANKLAAGKAGAVEAAVVAMRNHSGDDTIQRVASSVVIIMTDGHAGNMTRALHAGAVDALVRAMCRFSSDEQMQYQACLFIATVDKDAHYVWASNAGVVEAIVAAMCRHTRSEAILQIACRALCDMTYDINAENMTRLRKTGIIEALVAAMQEHAGNIDAQSQASQLVHNLVVGEHIEDNLTRAGNAGVIEALVAALHSHPESEDVLTYTCKVLAIVVASDAKLESRALEAGAVEAISAALQYYGMHMQSKTVGTSCVTLCILTGGTKYKMNTMGSAGAVEVLVGAMCRHAGVGQVQLNACGALFNMCKSNVRNRACAINAGAKEAIHAALRTHSGDEYIVVAARGLLLLLD